VSMLQDRGVPLKTSCRVNSMHLQVFVKKFWEDRGPEVQKVMTRSSCMCRVDRCPKMPAMPRMHAPAPSADERGFDITEKSV
jgi:hypothetical protein